MKSSLACAVALIFPVVAIKWGQQHPHFHWQDFSSLLGEKASAPLSLTLPWQERSALLACLAIAAYIGFVVAFHTGEAGAPPRKWLQFMKDPERVFSMGSYAFLFFYIASAALCERTNMGTVAGDELLVGLYRDFGLALLGLFLFFLARLVVRGVSFNGMLVRKNVERSYRLLICAIGALAVCFATWFPLLALPGAWIMTKWCLGILSEIPTDYDASDDTEVESTA